MDNLLALVDIDRARELRLHAGAPPVIVRADEQHPLEGPPLTAENTEQLLRSIASTRQMRELNDQGGVKFIYTFRGTSPFLVSASIQNGIVGFDIQ